MKMQKSCCSCKKRLGDKHAKGKQYRKVQDHYHYTG